jgi:nicotinamide-nucleotide amidase
MPTAEIITIGTELLLGETIDTNTMYIARALRDAGVDLYRTSTIGDNEERIAQIIQEGMTRAEIIITTGGLGPTVDDPTRQAVARALGTETVFKEELWQQIQERFERYGHRPTENNRKQAFIPKGAIPVENPVGTAPAFIAETNQGAIISLPGVPREMEYLMQHKVLPYLRARFQLQSVIRTRILRTSGVGESQIDSRIDDLERKSNPTVGLSAHAGQVDVRITAKAETEEEVLALIQVTESEVRHRLGKWIYGADDLTLEQAAMNALIERGWDLAVVEAGLDGRLIRQLAKAEGPFLGGEMLTDSPDTEALLTITRNKRQSQDAKVVLGLVHKPGETKQTLHIALITPDETREITRTYGGPPQLAPRWSVNISLDLIRRL